jgi:hypothetical protein
MSKEWKTIAVSFAITIIILFALVIGVNAQETNEVPISCAPTQYGKALLERISKMPGVTVIELSGAEKDRFIEFLAKNGGALPEDLVGINLIQIDASANLGNPRTSFMIIRNEEPSHCTSRYFTLPPNVADMALAYIYGQKS